MVTEFSNPGAENPLPQDPEYAEHSAFARSKKVIPGPLYIPRDPAAPAKSIDPINGVVAGASASMTLLRNKAYRVVSTTACHFRQTLGASTALTTDIYLPANQPVVMVTSDWNILSFIQNAAGGTIQAVEVK